MDFKLTPLQQMTRRAVREFVRKEVVPLAAEWDEKDEFPSAIYRQALALEVLELTLPEALGGVGDDFLSFILALEEFAFGSAALAHCIAVTEAIVHLLARYGSKQQQQQYLVPLLAGEIFGAPGVWLPGAQKNSTGPVQAVTEAEGYRLSGSLLHVPFAPAAELIVVFATFENGDTGAFLLKQPLPGLKVSAAETLMGVRGFPLGRLEIKDVRVSADHLLGSEKPGPTITDALLMRTEAAAGAVAVGLSQAALEAAVKHSKARVQFGKTLAEMEATQNKIADMTTGIESARLMVYEASFFLEQVKTSTRQTAMAKLIASELAVRVCREAVQIHGGYGYVKDYAVERLYRDALFSQLYPTANEAQRAAIAQHAYRKIR